MKYLPLFIIVLSFTGLQVALAASPITPQQERRMLRAEEVAKHNVVGTYNAHGLTIEIQSMREVPDGGVEVFARAWRNGEPVGFADGTVEVERFLIFNPPLLVPDPAGTIKTKYKDKGKEEVHSYRQDPAEALRQSLAHTISVVARGGEHIEKGKRGNTTSTFFPDADPETSSVDGAVVRSGVNEVFATIRAGAGVTADDTSGNSSAVDLLATATTDQYEALSRSIYVFDTSTIADSESVNSATLSICSRSTVLDQLGGGGAVGITSGTSASATALAASDYQSNTSGTRFASDIDVGSWAADLNYNDFTLNASGLGNISVTGVSKFASRVNFDIDNSTVGITWASGEEILARSYMAEQAGTTCDPKLVVVSSSGFAFWQFFTI